MIYRKYNSRLLYYIILITFFTYNILFSQFSKESDTGFLKTAKESKEYLVLQTHSINTKPTDIPPFISLVGHTGLVNCVVYSNDGKILASGGDDATVCLWNASQGTLTRKLIGQNGRITSVAISPDGTKIASGGSDGTCKVWKISSGEMLYTLSGYLGVTSVCFSPDGTKIAFGCLSGRITISDSENGQLINYFGWSPGVLSISYSSDGSVIAAGGYSQRVKLWNPVTGISINSSGWAAEYTINSLSYSPDGRKLAVASQLGSIQIWNLLTGSNIKFSTGTQNSVQSISFSQNGKEIASGSNDGMIKIWDVESGSLTRAIPYGPGYPRSICFDKTSNKIAAAGDAYQNLRIYNLDYPSTLNLHNIFTFPKYKNFSDYKGTEYQLIGFPGNPNFSINQWLSGSPDKDWKAFSASGADLVKYDGSDKFFLITGKGFLILKKGDWEITENVPSAPFNSEGEFEISLSKGWNFITNPFTSPLKWSVIQAWYGITEPIYSLNNNSNSHYSFSQSPLLEPYKGYCLYSQLSRTLKIPYRAYINPEILINEKIDWKVDIILKSDNFEDRSVYFGVSKEASDAFDKFKVHKPNLIQDMPAVYFKRTEWDREFSEFASDIKPPQEKEIEWDFEIRIKKNKLTNLIFSGIKGVPDFYSIYLIDYESGKSTNLRNDSIYTFTPTREINKFGVIVGKEEDIIEKIKIHIPNEFILGPNYPNPFNPTTIIPVSIPIQSEIKLSIYNILGEEIKVLYSGIIPAGKYSFEWDGKDNNRNKLSSGIYFYNLRMETGKILSGKMILMK